MLNYFTTLLLVFFFTASLAVAGPSIQPNSSAYNTSFPPNEVIIFSVSNLGCNTCSYSYTVQNGTIIGSSFGTDQLSVAVTFNNVSGNGRVTVTVSNCASSCNGTNYFENPIRYLGPIGNIKLNGTAYTGTRLISCGTSPITVSVDPVTNANSYAWSYPPGWTKSGTGNTVTLTPSLNTEGTIIVIASRSDVSNLSASSGLNITRPLPSLTSVSNVNLLFCDALTTRTLSATGANADKFVWTPSANVKINGSSSPQNVSGSVSVSTSGTGSFTIKAYSTACAIESTNSITKNTKFGPPTSKPTSAVVISGPSGNQLCRNQSMTIALGYSGDPAADQVDQANWSFGSWSSYVTGYGDPIPTAQSRPIFVLSSGAASSQSLTVNFHNACGNSNSYSATFSAVSCGSFKMVYPNPASDVISLSFDESSSALLPEAIEIFSEKTGKSVYRTDGVAITSSLNESILQIPVKDFPRGVYYLHVVASGVEKATEKVRLDLK